MAGYFKGHRNSKTAISISELEITPRSLDALYNDEETIIDEHAASYLQSRRDITSPVYLPR